MIPAEREVDFWRVCRGAATGKSWFNIREGQEVFPSPNVCAVSGVHLVFCSVDTGSSLPCSRAARAWGWPLQLIGWRTRATVSASTPTHTPLAFTACTGNAFWYPSFVELQVPFLRIPVSRYVLLTSRLKNVCSWISLLMLRFSWCLILWPDFRSRSIHQPKRKASPVIRVWIFGRKVCCILQIVDFVQTDAMLEIRLPETLPGGGASHLELTLNYTFVSPNSLLTCPLDMNI